MTAFSSATENLATFFEARAVAVVQHERGAEHLHAGGGVLRPHGEPGDRRRSTSGFTGFTIFLSALTGTPLATAGLTRMYYGVQFNTEQGTETDMGYRYLTTNQAEAAALENLGPAAKRRCGRGLLQRTGSQRGFGDHRVHLLVATTRHVANDAGLPDRQRR